MAKIKYTDIGHSHPNDVLWIWIDGALDVISAGHSRTHHLVWGGDYCIEKYWRGRFELATGRTSIMLPVGESDVPHDLMNALTLKFATGAFTVFRNIEEEIEI